MSWKKVKLGEFLKNREIRYKPKDKAIEGLKRIEKIDFSGTIYLSDKPSNTDMILVKKGDLVISGINVEKGAMSVYQETEDVTATIHYSSYSYDEKKIDIEFLKMFLKSQEFIEALKEQVPGGIKTEIKPKHLLPLEVYIPTTLSEQRNVVNSFNNKKHTNIKISSELDRQLDLIKRLRQSFLREAMQGKLTEDWRKQNPNTEPASVLLQKIKKEKEKLIKEGKIKKQKPLPAIKDDETPFQVPNTWAWARLGEACYYTEYGTSQKAEMSEEHVPVLRMNNILDGKIDFNNLKYVSSTIKDLPRLFLKNGDLIFNRTNSFELVGKTAIYFGNEEKFTFASYLIRIRLSNYVSPLFLNYYFNSILCRTTQIEPDTIQQNGQANFNGTKLNNIICPIPSFSEQKQIAEGIDTIMKHCDDLELSIKQSKEQNVKLLQVVLKEALEKYY